MRVESIEFICCLLNADNKIINCVECIFCCSFIFFVFSVAWHFAVDCNLECRKERKGKKSHIISPQDMNTREKKRRETSSSYLHNLRENQIYFSPHTISYATSNLIECFRTIARTINFHLSLSGRIERSRVCFIKCAVFFRQWIQVNHSLKLKIKKIPFTETAFLAILTTEMHGMSFCSYQGLTVILLILLFLLSFSLQRISFNLALFVLFPPSVLNSPHFQLQMWSPFHLLT